MSKKVQNVGICDLLYQFEDNVSNWFKVPAKFDISFDTVMISSV